MKLVFKMKQSSLEMYSKASAYADGELHSMVLSVLKGSPWVAPAAVFTELKSKPNQE